MLPRNKISLIHVAKAQLDLDDETYREIIESACGKGVRSATQIKHNGQFISLMGKFAALGFEPNQKQGYRDFRQNPGRRPAEWASPEQLEKIVALWKSVTRYPEKWSATLDNFLLRRFHCHRLNALTRDKAANVIEALKNMQGRQSSPPFEGGQGDVFE